MNAEQPALAMSQGPLASAWPLFALRIRSERLVMRLPTDADLLAMIDLARAGIHPPDTMPFSVAWSVRPSPDFERAFLQHHWLARAQWSEDDWRLNLMVEWDGRVIGSQSIWGLAFPVHRAVDTGSWLGSSFQGQGLGKEMRSAALAFVFDSLGARLARSEAFLDNAASMAVSRSLGYEDDGFGAHAPQGVSRETRRYRLTADGWRARRRSPVTVDGLETCREMFGG
ncbi:MAG: GNAT family N-acetyltransferase [Chloroflexota bacterium]|jgi:RimJ/RimL family protein N-acetyltransferase|nr:GNAT family N-acetyltransferase [Chloroflexota bacterium]MDH5243066.1 GNAT family N-acetyltransferase [Chloroflexota bacterium]